MKRISLFLILVFSIIYVACADQKPKSPYLIKGQLDGLNNHELFLSYFIGDKRCIDTAVVDGDNFQIKVKANKQPVPAFLVVKMKELNKYLKNGKGYIPAKPIALFLENTNISVSGSVYALEYAEVRGGDLNKDHEKLKKLTEVFRKKLDTIFDIVLDSDENSPEFKEAQQQSEKVEREIRKLNLKFINENPASVYAAFLSLQKYSTAEDLVLMKEIYANFTKKVQRTDYAKKLQSKISNVEKSSIGQLAPNFKKTTAKGKQISLSDYKGKYILIDFWGSWCGPCRKSHPHLVHLYQTYKGKDFVLLGVAQDGNEKAWLRAIEMDKMEWPQINSLNKIEEFDIVKEFAVSGFPTKILINPEGKIIKRFVGYDDAIAKDMDDTLSKLLK